MEEMDGFKVILLGVVFNPKTKKILIGRRKKDPYIKNLTWAFPGGQYDSNEELDSTLKKKIKLKTGLKVENLGNIFSKTYPEDRKLLAIYYLCEATGGKEKAANDFTELKWVTPKDLKEYFTTSFHPKLKEYIEGLVH